MKDIVLQAQKRGAEEKLKDLRREKTVPCVVYGKKQEAIAIKVNNADLIKTYRKAGESHIILLDIEGEKIEVLVHQHQKNPVTGDFIHMDFYAVVKWEKVTTTIVFDFIGNSAAAKEWAVIQEIIKDIEVKVLPKDLVDNFEVNLEKLKNIGDMIRIGDLGIDTTKFEHNLNEEDVVVLASEPRKVVEEVSEEVSPEDVETVVQWEKEEA